LAGHLDRPFFCSGGLIPRFQRGRLQVSAGFSLRVRSFAAGRVTAAFAGFFFVALPASRFFFRASVMAKSSGPSNVGLLLGSDMLPVIPGLRYLPDYLDFETHARLWVAADLQPWRRAQERGIQIYGYSYHHTHGGGIYRMGDLPPWALDVATRLWRDGLMPDTIVSISLGSSCVMQFTESNSGREEQLLLEPRSALVLSGEARSHWRHAIPARLSDVWMNHESARTRRVSLTFRKMLKASASPE
jgi:hypothetical protein